MPLADVDTPALILDLEAFEQNLKRLNDSLAGRGVQLRPHAKSHKCPEIALRQMALGAVGVCCQKVSEAEAMVDGGVSDVLIANEVVGAAKLRRVAALARRNAPVGTVSGTPKPRRPAGNRSSAWVPPARRTCATRWRSLRATASPPPA